MSSLRGSDDPAILIESLRQATETADQAGIYSGFALCSVRLPSLIGGPELKNPSRMYDFEDAISTDGSNVISQVPSSPGSLPSALPQEHRSSSSSHRVNACVPPENLAQVTKNPCTARKKKCANVCNLRSVERISFILADHAHLSRGRTGLVQQLQDTARS
jgi:hypothetical protein